MSAAPHALEPHSDSVHGHSLRRRSIVLTAVLALTLSLLAVTPAVAAVSCTYDSPTKTVTIASTAAETMNVGHTSGSGVIFVNAAFCPGFPTLSTTDTIIVTGSGANQDLIIDLENGNFAPGSTLGDEGTSPEIEWNVDLGGGTDSLRILGDTVGFPSPGDTLTFGANGVGFNVDNDTDLTFAGVEAFAIDGREGSDIISGAGGNGTGGAFPMGITFNGGAENDTETGGAGDDVFFQEAATNGGDTINGGAGTDTVDYSQRAIRVQISPAGGMQANDGEDNPDTSSLGANPVEEGDNLGADIENALGGAGNDVVGGNALPNNHNGGAGNDSVSGGDGNDNLIGGDGNDSVSGGGGDDVLNGGPGNDSFGDGGGPGSDTIIGGPGVDSVSYVDRDDVVIVTMGDNAFNDGVPGENDNVGAAPGGDVENITGGDGDDHITGNDLNNSITGGSTGIDETAGDGTDLLIGGNGDDTINGASDGDTILGGNGNDILIGGPGDDTEFGGPGDDTFNEGATSPQGADTLFGESGVDTVDYSGRVDAVFVNLGDNTDDDGELEEHDYVGAGAFGGDIENAIGGGGPDELIGNAANNLLSGGLGTDTESGLGGDDTFRQINRTITVTPPVGPPQQQRTHDGNDTLNGGAGSDTVDYSVRPVVITLSLGDAMANDGEMGEADNVGAGDMENAITGSGNDLVTGTASDNRVAPGTGNDNAWGFGGSDTIDYSTLTVPTPTVTATVSSIATGTATGSSGNDTFFNFENAIGSSGNDILNGDGGPNVLRGFLGNDTENGAGGDDLFNQESFRNGADVLNGGAGNDTADYSARFRTVSVTLDGVANDGESGESDNVMGDVENVLNPVITELVLPEGATHSGFTTFVLLSNPDTSKSAIVNLIFLTSDGPIAPGDVQGIDLKPRERMTINVNQLLGDSQVDVATKVFASAAPVVAEVSVHKAGSLASMDMAATAKPSRTWILPEGVTHSDFTSFVTIANPDEATATHVNITYLTKSGEKAGPQNLLIPAGSRRTITVNNAVAQGGCGCSDDVSTLVNVVGSEPEVVAGISVHKQSAGDLAIGGSLGVTDAKSAWVVPEGATHSGWSTFVLIANPSSTAASVNVRFLTPTGPIVASGVVVPAKSRRTINVGQACGCQTDVSTLITSSMPVAVESTIQRDDVNGFLIADSVGAGGNNALDASGTSWLAAEGATHNGFNTFILIANADLVNPASVALTFLTDEGAVSGPTRTIPAGGRVTVRLNDVIALMNKDVSTLVSATSGKVVVEMSIDRIASGYSKGRSLAFRLTP